LTAPYGVLSFPPVKRAVGTRASVRAQERRAQAPAGREAGIEPLFALGIFALALLVRAVYLWQLSRSPLAGIVAGDGEVYDAWAQRIASGDWLGRSEGVFYQAPLYPYLLGTIYAVAGHTLWAVRIVQALLGAASCVMLANAGSAFFSRRAGILAGTVLALYPPAIFFDGLLQKSGLDLFLVCALLLLLSRSGRVADEGPPPWRWVLLGVTLGALMLSRENAAVLAAGVLVWLLVEYRTEPWAARLHRAGLLVAGLAAVLLPVAVRNRAVGGELHLTTSQFGTNLFIGNNASAEGFYVPLRAGRGNAKFERQDAVELAQLALGRPLTAGEVSRFWAGEAVKFVREHPARWLALTGKKVLLVFNATEVGDTDDLYGASDYCSLLRVLRPVLNFGVLMSLAVFGVAATWSRRGRVWVLYLLTAAYAASVAVFYVFARYRYPLVPFLVLLASAGLAEAWVAVREKRARALVVPAVLALAAAGVAAVPLVKVDGLRALTEIGIGNDLTGKRRYSEAVAHYAAALRLEPRSAEARLDMAGALKAMGRTGEAFEQVRQAAVAAPEFELAQFAYGAALAEAGKPQEAIPYLLKAIELNPSHAEAYNQMGNCLFAVGQLPTAAESYRKAVELDPPNATAHNNWGTAAARMGDLPGAVEHFKAAVAADPGYAEAHRNLGKAFLAMGRPGEAAAELAAALKLRPGDADVRRWLDQARQGAGRTP